MSEQRRSDRARRAAFVALWLAVGLAIRLVVAWRNLGKSLPTTLPDDAFYDFAIAHHIVLGHPPSIDGVTATNGYHPLWVGLLVIVYALTGKDLIRPIHWAMTLGAVFDVVAGFMLYGIARKLRLRFPVRLLLLAWLMLDPFEVFVSTCGLESSLALALGLALVWLDLEYAAARRRPILYGVVAGLAILARTDQVILVATLLAWRFAPRSARQGASWLVVAAGATSVTVLPWLVYSYATTGTIIQSSAFALPFIVHHMPLADGQPSVTMWLTVRRAAASTYEAAAMAARGTGVGVSGAVFAFGMLAAAVALARGRAGRALWARLRLAGAFPVAMLVLFVLHASVRNVFREWYTPPIVAAWGLVAAIGLDHVVRFGRMPRATVGALALSLALALLASARHELEFPIYGVTSYVQPRPAPASEHIAMTDCGREAYFMVRGRTNLDGIVNNDAFRALASGRLLEYLRQKQFTRIGASDYYHSRVYFGARYREWLRRAEDNPFLTRFVKDAAEKDALVPLSDNAVLLGSREGREYLDDGWLWTEQGTGDGFAVSIGQSSEILFVPHDSAGRTELSIQLRAAVVDPATDLQRVQFFLNNVPLGFRDVKTTPDTYRLPARALVQGRNRLRLVYSWPRELPPEDRIDAWRYHTGNLVRAVDAGALSLVDTRSLRLPPNGPDLAHPGGAQILESGWLPVDQGPTPAAWAVGHVARLRFWDDGPARSRTLTLRVGPPAPTASGAGQNIDVVLNGTSVGRVELVPGEVDNYSVRVPPGSVRYGFNSLELHFARTVPDPAAGVSRSAYLFGVRLE